MLLAIAVSQSNAQDQIRFTRTWWSRLEPGEQYNFVAGYLDCKQGKQPAGLTIDDYTKFIAKHGANKSIPSLILQANRTLHSRPVPLGGEVWHEKHGYYDGGYFGSGTPQASWLSPQIGFVEGYLACKSGSVSDIQVESVVHVLQEHYRSGRNEHDKIADIIESAIKRSKS